MLRKKSVWIPILGGLAGAAVAGAGGSSVVAALSILGIAGGVGAALWHRNATDEEEEIESSNNRFFGFLTINELRDFAKQAMLHEGRIEVLSDGFKQSITKKLTPNELSTVRLTSQLDKIVNRIQTNLENTWDRMNKIRSFDTDWTRMRLNQLNAQKSLTSEDEREIATLKERSNQIAIELQKVSDGLTQNEELISSILELYDRLQKLNTDTKDTAIDAIEEMSRTIDNLTE